MINEKGTFIRVIFQILKYVNAYGFSCIGLDMDCSINSVDCDATNFVLLQCVQSRV